MSKQITPREGARRQHRALGVFAVLQCWIRNLDGVCFQSIHFQRIIGLDQFKGNRITWLKADLAEFFEHPPVFILRKPKKYSSLFVSRMPLTSLPTGDMEDEDRIEGIPKDGPRIGIFQLWPHLTVDWGRLRKGFDALIPFFTTRSNCDERILTSYLSLIAGGQMSLRFLIKQISKMNDSGNTERQQMDLSK